MLIRSRFASRALALLVGPALLFVLGCSGDDGLGKRYRVSGQVTYKGQPVEKGVVNFVPLTEGGHGATGQIENGSYSLTTLNLNDGAMSGKYKVTIDTRRSMKRRLAPPRRRMPRRRGLPALTRHDTPGHPGSTPEAIEERDPRKVQAPTRRISRRPWRITRPTSTLSSRIEIEWKVHGPRSLMVDHVESNSFLSDRPRRRGRSPSTYFGPWDERTRYLQMNRGRCSLVRALERLRLISSVVCLPSGEGGGLIRQNPTNEEVHFSQAPDLPAGRCDRRASWRWPYLRPRRRRKLLPPRHVANRSGTILVAVRALDPRPSR